MKKRKLPYKNEYPRLLYTYFVTYGDAFGAPSLSKFARSIGATMADIERFRAHAKFDEACRECNEIRRDYLIDNALSKRFDSSFTKFLISLEYPENTESENNLAVTLEVLEDVK